LRAVSKSLAAIFSRSCILSPHCIWLCGHNRFGKRCRFGIGLNAQGEQRKNRAARLTIGRPLRFSGLSGQTARPHRPNPRRRPSWSQRGAFGPAPKTREWNKSYPSELEVKKSGRDLMDRITHCPKCEKRRVPVVSLSGRTDLQCISCDDPVVKWAESPFIAPEKPVVAEPASHSAGTQS